MDWVVLGVLVVALVVAGPVLGTIAFFQLRGLRRELEALKSGQWAQGQGPAAVSAAAALSRPPSMHEEQEEDRPPAQMAPDTEQSAEVTPEETAGEVREPDPPIAEGDVIAIQDDLSLRLDGQAGVIHSGRLALLD